VDPVRHCLDQGQDHVPAEGNDDRLLLDTQHSRVGIFPAGPNVGSAIQPSPFGNGLLVDPVAFIQNP
jgi:hypothetical protein